MVKGQRERSGWWWGVMRSNGKAKAQTREWVSWPGNWVAPRWLSGKVHLPMQEMQVQNLSWEDPLEEDMATHSSILAWKIPWTEEPGGLQSRGLQRLGHDWAIAHARSVAGTPSPWLWGGGHWGRKLSLGKPARSAMGGNSAAAPQFWNLGFSCRGLEHWDHPHPHPQKTLGPSSLSTVINYELPNCFCVFLKILFYKEFKES